MPLFCHPAEVCMTYAEHARFALWLSGQLALAAAASLVHAFVPDVFERTSSTIILDLARVLRETGCREHELES
jgi:hypothetical protein